MRARTAGERILSLHSGTDSVAGDIVVCEPDLVIGTDASSPMAIDYFEAMGGTTVFDPARVLISLDHYSPPTTESTRGFHARIHTFAERFGVEVLRVGDGISHQVAPERGRVHPGMLIIGADSHVVTCGALGAFATGVGSSDLAAAMITGKVWLRVPDTIQIDLHGTLPAGVAAKDAALVLVRMLGSEGANYQALEFTGDVGGLSIDDRFVLSNLSVEAGAKAAIFPADEVTWGYLASRAPGLETAETPASPRSSYAKTLTLDLGSVGPSVALPHSPADVVDLTQVAGTPIHMAFVGTCTGGRIADIHVVLDVIERNGGHIAPGVQLVVTPASAEIESALRADGTLPRLEELGATVTTAGCGACCGTSGVRPAEGTNVISTANRNFQARMGTPSASIFLASPAACAAAAVAGRLVDPRRDA